MAFKTCYQYLTYDFIDIFFVLIVCTDTTWFSTKWESKLDNNSYLMGLAKGGTNKCYWNGCSDINGGRGEWM